MTDAERKQRGRIIRGVIRQTFGCRLRPNGLLPPTRSVADAFGISRVQAWKHVRRAMEEAGEPVRGARFIGLVVERGRG